MEYVDWLRTLTARQLTKESERQDLFSSYLTEKCISEGYGNYRYSDMRKLENPPPFIIEKLAVADKQREISLEMERRNSYHGSLKPIKGGG